MMELCKQCGVMLTDYEISTCEGLCYDCHEEKKGAAVGPIEEINENIVM